MGRLRYRTLKDTGAGHHHACPLPLVLPQERREKDRDGGEKDRRERQKEKTERGGRKVQ